MARAFNNNTSNYISCGDHTALRISGTFTVAGWANFATTASNQFILNYDNGAATHNQAYTLQADVVGTFVLKSQTADGVTVSTVTGNTTLSASTWYHLAISYDGTNVRLYVNGSLDAGPTASVTPGGYTGSPDGLRIGEYSKSGGTTAAPMNGNVADTAVWNIQLSAGEISGLAKGRRPNEIRGSSGLVSWPPLDGLQSPEPDLSGHAFNGTLNGSVTAASGPPIVQFTPRWPRFLGWTPMLPASGLGWIINRRIKLMVPKKHA